MIHPSLEPWPLYRESTNQVTVPLCLSRIQQKTPSLTLSFSLSFFSLRDCKSYIRSSKFLCLTSILKFDQKWTNSKVSLLWQTVQIVSMLQNIQITMLTLLKHPYISTSRKSSWFNRLVKCLAFHKHRHTMHARAIFFNWMNWDGTLNNWCLHFCERKRALTS